MSKNCLKDWELIMVAKRFSLDIQVRLLLMIIFCNTYCTNLIPISFRFNMLPFLIVWNFISNFISKSIAIRIYRDRIRFHSLEFCLFFLGYLNHTSRQCKFKLCILNVKGFFRDKWSRGIMLIIGV